MLSLPRNLTSTSPWSSVSSPQFLAQLGFRPDQPGDLRSLLRGHRQARVLEGCAQLSGSGKVTLRGAGDFGQSPDRESRKNPQRWGKAGSKVTVTVAGFRTALLCGSGRVGAHSGSACLLALYRLSGGFPKLRFLPHTFPLLHPSVYHLQYIFVFFFSSVD